jgi:hypothetical protein
MTYGRHHPSKGHRANQPVLRNRDTAVRIALLVVESVRPARSTETDEATDDERDVGETGVALGPAVVRLEAERDGGKEEESDSPLCKEKKGQYRREA